MAQSPHWRDMAAGTRVFGALFAALLAASVALLGNFGAGYAQRAIELAGACGVAILAMRVAAIERRDPQETK